MNECIIFHSTKRAFVITITSCVQNGVISHCLDHCRGKSAAKILLSHKHDSGGIVIAAFNNGKQCWCLWMNREIWGCLHWKKFISFIIPVVDCNQVRIKGMLVGILIDCAAWKIWLTTMCLHTTINGWIYCDLKALEIFFVNLHKYWFSGKLLNLAPSGRSFACCSWINLCIWVFTGCFEWCFPREFPDNFHHWSSH